eukprot:scpid77074/ scgid3557/ 
MPLFYSVTIQVLGSLDQHHDKRVDKCPPLPGSTDVARSSFVLLRRCQARLRADARYGAGKFGNDTRVRATVRRSQMELSQLLVSGTCKQAAVWRGRHQTTYA